MRPPAEPKVCQWLRRPGHDLETLRQRDAIFVQPRGALRLLCYNSARSPRTRLADQCRGLILNADDDWRPVCWGMDRFFHDGERRDWQPAPPMRLEDKEDGTFIQMYHHDGGWRAATRHTFLEDDRRYLTLLLEASGCADLDQLAVRTGARPGLTLCLELCGPDNRIVRPYAAPTVFLLAAYALADHRPVRDEILDEMAAGSDGAVQRPAVTFGCASAEDAHRILARRVEEDVLFEGFVIKDADNRRLKVKNPRYHLFSQLKYRSWARATPALLVPFLLRRQEDALLGTLDGLVTDRALQEFQARCVRYGARIDIEVDALATLWAALPQDDRRSAAQRVHQSDVATATMLLRFYGEPTPGDWRTVLLLHLERTIRGLFPEGQHRDPLAQMLDDHPPRYCDPPTALSGTETEIAERIPEGNGDGGWSVWCACGAPMALQRLKVDRVRYRRCHCGGRFGMHTYAAGTLLWVCDRCDCDHEAHQRDERWPDEDVDYAQGQPLGVPASARGKALRLQVHERLFALRRQEGFDRSAAYQWLSLKLGLPRHRTHVALFDAPRCAAVIRMIDDSLRVSDSKEGADGP
ncbi:MAG: RNA ligase [Myxococcota bacterium]